MKRACINLKLDAELTNLIYKSLEPEISKEKSHSNIKLEVEPDGLRLTIEASELSGLRAALNSYIRWINCINSIRNVVQPKEY
jgi:tRNA threonylcarbamoyladenosine modification (KEOPS) complex  Pcc1 subunit